MFSIIFAEFDYYKFCLHYIILFSHYQFADSHNHSYRYRLWCRGISKLRRRIAWIDFVWRWYAFFKFLQR